MRRRGFTLVELLTVVAIIATLAAILFVMLGSSKGRAKIARCAANMDQIGKSLMLYCADHDENVPPFLNFAALKGLNPGGNPAPWRAVLQAYAKDSRIFFCPDDPLAYHSPGVAGVSLVDHRQTSYANTEWMRDYVTNDVLSLNLESVASPSTAAYLHDDAVAQRNGVPWTPHDNRPNALYLDGHVAREPNKVHD